MAFVHGKSGVVFMNQSVVSTYIKSYNASWKRKLADVTALQAGGTTGLPGLNEGNLKIDGMFDSSASTLYATAVAEVGVDDGLHVTVTPEGTTSGNPAIFAACDITDFSVESQVDDAVSTTVEAATDNNLDFGNILTYATASASANTAAVDNGAATANGGAAMLHVLGVNGTSPTLDVKVQHSVDNVTYVDLSPTFTQASGGTSQRIEIAAATTVNRYVRGAYTIAGTSPVFTFALSFARR